MTNIFPCFFNFFEGFINVFNSSANITSICFKLGFTRAMIPEANKPKQAIPGMEIVAVRRVEEAFQKLRELE